ncbi:hypothetical protein KKC45_03940 [Patescibacteria group bacterium]|nr:hypothetical protein [Patescibacteria group bacterium]
MQEEIKTNPPVERMGWEDSHETDLLNAGTEVISIKPGRSYSLKREKGQILNIEVEEGFGKIKGFFEKETTMEETFIGTRSEIIIQHTKGAQFLLTTTSPEVMKIRIFNLQKAKGSKKIPV